MNSRARRVILDLGISIFPEHSTVSHGVRHEVAQLSSNVEHVITKRVTKTKTTLTDEDCEVQLAWQKSLVSGVKMTL